MSTSTLSVSIKQLLAELRSDSDGRTDEELLSGFVRRRDEDSLAVLVHRHASMVWGVCRRLLRNTQDAEDAFQATFLVLVRKASCVPRQAVPNWLYGVARQTAVRALTTVAKRGQRETQVVNMPETAMSEVRDDDLQIVVDAELSRLPGHYRGVVILCDLEGMTRKEAARQLGIPEGSVASRLARARALLAKRLQQRGVMFSSSVAAVLSAGSASSAPPKLVASTINAAGLLAAGQTTGVASLKVAALTEGVVKVMFVCKLKAMFSVVLALGILATGATFRTYYAAAGQDDTKPVAEKPLEPTAKQEKEKKEPVTAWGEEVNGVQIGIQLGDQRIHEVGENATLILRLRNNGKVQVPYRYGDEYFLKNPPLITDASGKAVTIKAMSVFGHVLLKSVAPGKEVDLVRLQLDLRPATDRSKDAAWTIYGTGKFQVQYPVTGVVGEVRPDLPGMKLVTGTLELEVKEPFTAWGKEVGGLQAGLGFKAGEKRVYIHGEKVTLVVRLRNVGKEPVTFGEGLVFWKLTNPISVTDSDGKAVYVHCIQPFGSFGQLGHRKTQLPPGKEVEYDQVTLQLKPAVAQEKQVPDNILFGSGKFRVEYHTDGFGSNNPATGKLELEVKEPEKVPQDKKEAFIAAPLPKEKAKTDYWPRRAGDKWVYTLDGREVSEEVARVTEKDGETRVTTTHTDGTDSLEIEYLVKGGAVYQTKSGLYTFDPPIRQVDIELKAGAKWESKTPLTEGVIGNCGEMVAGEEEEVKVPAGTFKAVPVVYTVTEVDGKPIAKLKVYTYWYAAGVGVVKLKYDGGEKVLKAFTPTNPKPKAKKVSTPEQAVKIASDGKLAREFNENKSAVEFKVEFVTKTIQVKASGEKDAAWVHGHSPNDVCLGLLVPNTPGAAIDLVKRDHIRFVAILTEKVIGQLNKAGITDLEKHFKGKTVRVTGPISRHAYDGFGSPDEVEIVLDDMSQLEAVK